MAGYRDTSSYDPYAGGDYGPPLRPYNWVQWVGVAFIAVGTIWALAFLLGQAGVIPKILGKSPQPFTTFPLIGVVLVNSRRRPLGSAEEAQRRRNYRAMLITVAIVAPILIVAALVSIWTGK